MNHCVGTLLFALFFGMDGIPLPPPLAQKWPWHMMENCLEQTINLCVLIPGRSISV